MRIGWGPVARALLVTVALIMGVVVTGGPASAATVAVEHARAGTDTAAGPGGGGVRVRVSINRASLFQCPAPHCNQGEASPPHDVRLYCKLDHTSNGWVLVLNRTNWHVGWIDIDWLTDPDGSPLITYPPLCFGHGDGTRVRNNTVLYQCPGVNCNRGQAATTHDVAVICPLFVGQDDTGWRFVVNHSNDHVGYIQSRHLNPDRLGDPFGC